MPTPFEIARTYNPKLNCFLQIFNDGTIPLQAGKLNGLTVGVKDVFALADQRLTCASKILENFESQYTATAVQRLIDAGALIVGKTNMDEFAMGSSNENSAFGSVQNPWDISRVPGGSSGGSAVATAIGACRIALFNFPTRNIVMQAIEESGVIVLGWQIFKQVRVHEHVLEIV